MMGSTLGDKALAQIRAGLRKLDRIGQATRRPQRGTRLSPSKECACILDEELETAETSLEPTKCKARRLKWNTTDEEYAQTGAQIDVFNHSETVDFPVDTFGFARWVDGHWVFVGDCSVMVERPEPPDLDSELEEEEAPP